MTHDDRLIDLTRRQVLVGAGAIGLASAGAGLGTSALFSDRESFADNVITAGTLDLLVHYDSEYNGTPAENLAPNPNGVVDGAPGLFYTLDDVKPGDSGWFQFCFELNTNPAYLWVCTEQTADAENGQNEPEEEAEGTDTDGLGELDDAILVDVYYAQEDGTPIPGGELASGVTLAGALAAFENGRALNFDAVDENPGDQTPYPPSNGPGVVTGPCVRFDWVLPLAVGNEVQSDSLAFAIDFHAIQARNTDGTDNPCDDTATGDTGGSTGGGTTQPPSTDFEDEQDDGWKLTGDATTGDAQVVASGGNPSAYLEGDDTVSGGIWYFDAPASFLGDQSAFAGGSLAYDLQQDPRSNQIVRDDLVLVGASTTLTYRYDSISDYPAQAPAWTEYDIPLDTSAGWRVGDSGSYGSRPLATPTEIAAVLGDLTALRIRGEFRNGSDTGGLDNPRFVAP